MAARKSAVTRGGAAIVDGGVLSAQATTILGGSATV